MRIKIKIQSTILLFALVLLTLGTGCKAKKELAQTQALEQEAKLQKIEQARDLLKKILNDESLSLEEREDLLRTVEGLGLEDEEVSLLYDQASAKIRQDKDERAAALAKEDAARDKMAAEAEFSKLNKLFDEIAFSSNSEQSRRKMTEVISMFGSEETAVLIIFDEADGIKYYDRPTDIKRYLEYLMDQKKSPNKVDTIEMNDMGKIVSIELRKK